MKNNFILELDSLCGDFGFHSISNFVTMKILTISVYHDHDMTLKSAIVIE